jgi:hypothetical protein
MQDTVNTGRKAGKGVRIPLTGFALLELQGVFTILSIAYGNAGDATEFFESIDWEEYVSTYTPRGSSAQVTTRNKFIVVVDGAEQFRVAIMLTNGRLSIDFRNWYQ